MDHIEFTYIKSNGITLHTAISGPENGPLVILLHGFPEFWYGWRKQIAPLAKAGYRVVVPDQRGYNLSDKPKGIEKYGLDTLRDDVIGLIEAMGEKKASIIGHDWGGVVAWHLAGSRPEYVEKLMIMNSPHPAIFQKGITRAPTQLLRSLYIMFFQIPRIPERTLSDGDFEALKKMFRKTSREGAFTVEDLKKYSTSWARTGAITSMLNWYRALRKGGLAQRKKPLIKAPVLIVWGIEDKFLSLKLAEESKNQCTNADLIYVDATHWVHHEQAEIVNGFMMEYLGKEEH